MRYEIVDARTSSVWVGGFESRVMAERYLKEHFKFLGASPNHLFVRGVSVSDLEELREVLRHLGISCELLHEDTRVVTDRGEAAAYVTLALGAGVGQSELRTSFYFDTEGKFLSHATHEKSKEGDRDDSEMQ